MKEQFVTYEIALKLKEKGFDEPCFGDYFHFERHNQSILDYDEDRERIITDNTDENITKYLAPLWQQVIDWFREKHNKVIDLHLWDREDKESWKYEVTEYGEYEMHFQTKNPKIKCSYEQARQTAIEHALTLI